jgi:hypothetical protein
MSILATAIFERVIRKNARKMALLIISLNGYYPSLADLEWLHPSIAQEITKELSNASVLCQYLINEHLLEISVPPESIEQSIWSLLIAVATKHLFEQVLDEVEEWCWANENSIYAVTYLHKQLLDKDIDVASELLD